MADVAVYQEAVKRLTAENKELKEKFTEAGRSHRQEIRALEVQLNEGLSPDLLALRNELRRWRRRALAAEGRLREMRRSVR